MSEIYQPAEDSFLMSKILKKQIPKFLKKNPNLKFLEVGAGSGINLQTAFESGIEKQNILSLDINLEAVKYCKSLGFDSIKSNLFKNIQKQKFNLIIFNPPYLPEDKNYLEPKDSKLITTGGKEGNELIIKFLKQAKNYLDKNGKIFLITSSLSEKIDFKKFNYNSRILDKKKLFFEEISLWELN